MTESKKCKTGYYYCFTDKKCKKIPMGYHIGARGYLARDNDEDSEEGKKNGNGKNGASNGNGGTNGGSNGGNGGVSEGTLHKWFKGSKSKDGKGGWVNVVTGGTCASDKPGEGTPKCVSSAKRASMSKAERKSAARRKKEADPGQQQKSGAAKPTYVATDSKRKKVDEEAVSKKQQRFFGMVRAAQKGEMENPSPEVAKVAATAKRSDVKKFASTKHKGLPMKKVEESISEAKDKKGKGSGTKDACYHKVKSRYSVWPSAYASGALVKCRKVGAANWGNKSEEVNLSDKLDEKCWKGYEKKGMKTMFGKRYPNCVKKKTTKEEAEMVRYCPKCEKNETRDECSYGPKTWDMYSVPANLGPNTFEEKYERIQRLGKTYTVFFTFRGQYKSLQFFFPTSARPSREEVLIQLRKIYPEAVLTNYFERDRVENEPLVQVEGAKSFGKFIGEGSRYGSYGLRPYDKIKMGDGKLKSLKDVDAKLKKTDIKNEDWQSVNKKDKTDGMSPKAVAAYRRENPGSKLKTAVTGDPKPGSKDAKRRKSYCARSKGQQDMHNIDCSKTPDKPVCKARRRWKC